MIISCREEGVFFWSSYVGACHTLVYDLISGLLLTYSRLLLTYSGLCQKFFVDFKVTKIEFVENYFDENFTNDNFRLTVHHMKCNTAWQQSNVVGIIHFMRDS